MFRICTGEFSGGPNKDVFRFVGRVFLPRERAVRVPFAAGEAVTPDCTALLEARHTGVGCCCVVQLQPAQR